ncbi:MAG TPA: Rpn family recombination-promoting nuclease/putative transposase, partial [Candidatus Blautia merdipullorum]|nr:Rpn family recombination-promoting nuclease/putative transposase [Candidatus Blautia merdipullorum]
REDSLVPVFSVVLYFGEQKWDGPLCLKEMMKLNTLPEEVREKIADYPVHLIDVRRYPHAERFRTDLKLVFGFLQRASEPEELTEFIEENTKEFSSLTEDAYDMIASMSKTGELKELKKDVGQEDYNMCKAIDMMVADGEKRGEERGETRGIEIGRNIFRLYMKGYKQKEIADKLKISLERVKDFLGEEATI